MQNSQCLDVRKKGGSAVKAKGWWVSHGLCSGWTDLQPLSINETLPLEAIYQEGGWSGKEYAELWYHCSMCQPMEVPG